MVVSEPCMGLALRPNIGMWKYVRICINTLTVEELSVSDYLKFKEGLTEAGKPHFSVVASREKVGRGL